MRLARVLGGIGRTLISAGVIILLFVAYQLWGTGIQHARAQDALASDFDELLDSVDPEELFADPAPGESPPEEAAPAGETDDADPPQDDDPVVGGDEVTEPVAVPISADLDPKLLELLYPDPGEVIGRLDIPRIGITEYIVEGVRVDDLRKGPGHYFNTPMPGQPGNAAVAGHRTTYGAPFHRIDELAPGDEINVRSLQGEFTYRVLPQTDADGETKGHFIVSPSDVGVLDDFGDNRLTLTACHPKYSARQRIIVVAELVEEPQPRLPRPEEYAQAIAARAGDNTTTEVDAADVPVVPLEIAEPVFTAEDSFGEGLNGDRDAIAPAITWGVAALAVWLAAWFLGRGWRKWISYGIALVPFLVLLFMSFVHIDQAIPSY